MFDVDNKLLWLVTYTGNPKIVSAYLRMLAICVSINPNIDLFADNCRCVDMSNTPRQVDLDDVVIQKRILVACVSILAAYIKRNIVNTSPSRIPTWISKALANTTEYQLLITKYDKMECNILSTLSILVVNWSLHGIDDDEKLSADEQIVGCQTPTVLSLSNRDLSKFLTNINDFIDGSVMQL